MMISVEMPVGRRLTQSAHGGVMTGEVTDAPVIGKLVPAGHTP